MLEGMNRATPADNRVPEGWRKKINLIIRHTVGLTQDPIPPCEDAELSYMSPASPARLVHGDLASMLVGGLGSLSFQMLHPYSMTGVAQHSRYQSDPLGRMLQTANFIGFTTYGPKELAYSTIERVLAVHEAVRGVADDGVSYYANDPHLLLWVHCAEMSMFLEGYKRFGRQKLTDEVIDEYVSDMAQLARDMRCENPPTTYRELTEVLESFRPELRLIPEGLVARDFVAHQIITSPLKKPFFWFFVQSSYALMEPWARDLLGVPRRDRLNRYFITPVTRVLCRLMRGVVPPYENLTTAA